MYASHLPGRISSFPAANGAGDMAMAHVVMAGASGLIGRALAAAFAAQGIGVRRLVRRPATGPDEVSWDPGHGRLDPAALEGASAVINLAGRAIAALRWTARVRAEILDSRVRATRLLVDALGKTDRRPQVFISASAIGIYGNRGDEILTEASPPGRGFLSDVAQAWEREAQRAAEAGLRVVCPRFGLVLARGGGFLAPMLPAFRLGLGGPFGGGRQWWSWVHIDDVVAAVLAALRTPVTAGPVIAGPVNVVAPNPVTNREFTRTLAAVLRRPAVLPVPAFALRIAMGQMADELVLNDQRVSPAALQAQGFAFRWPDLRPALDDVVGRASTRPGEPRGREDR
jgi:uncharacterized protein (TIGR01777 family)